MVRYNQLLEVGVKCVGFNHLCQKVQWRTTVQTTNTFVAQKEINYK